MGRLADDVGGRIRRRREALALSRAELAQRGGVSEEALGRIERGQSAPRLENLFALAEALRVRVEALLGPAAAARQGRTLALDRLIVYLSRAGERDIRMVHEIARGVLRGRTKKRRITAE